MTVRLSDHPPPPHDDELLARSVFTFRDRTLPIKIELRIDEAQRLYRVLVFHWIQGTGNHEWEVSGTLSTWFQMNEYGEAVRYYKARVIEAASVLEHRGRPNQRLLAW